MQDKSALERTRKVVRRARELCRRAAELQKQVRFLERKYREQMASLDPRLLRAFRQSLPANLRNQELPSLMAQKS